MNSPLGSLAEFISLPTQSSLDIHHSKRNSLPDLSLMTRVASSSGEVVELNTASQLFRSQYSSPKNTDRLAVECNAASQHFKTQYSIGPKTSERLAHLTAQRPIKYPHKPAKPRRIPTQSVDYSYVKNKVSTFRPKKPQKRLPPIQAHYQLTEQRQRHKLRLKPEHCLLRTMNTEFQISPDRPEVPYYTRNIAEQYALVTLGKANHS